MFAPVFVDTNLLLYAEDPRESAKGERARELIDEIIKNRSGHISMQVLQEFFSAASGKLKIDPVHVRRRLDVYMTMDIVILQPHDFLGFRLERLEVVNPFHEPRPFMIHDR